MKNQYRVNEQIRVGNEAEAGEGGDQGDPFRTSDR